MWAVNIHKSTCTLIGRHAHSQTATSSRLCANAHAHSQVGSMRVPMHKADRIEAEITKKRTKIKKHAS